MNLISKISQRINPQIIKFILTGIINTIFGYSVYAGLIFIKIPYFFALLIATIFGVIFNYFSFGKLVFSQKSNWWVFIKFITAYTIIYLNNVLLLRLLTLEFSMNPYLGQAICVPISVVLSWIIMNIWVYKKD